MRRFALFGAVLAALTVVSLIAWATRPAATGTATSGGQTAAVTSVTRSCPPAAPGTGKARVTMIAMPSSVTSVGGAAKSGAPSTGTATLSAVPAAPAASTSKAAGSGQPSASATTPAAKQAARPVTVSAPGMAAMVTPPDSGGAAVAATGRMAMGFEAELADASGTGLVTCTHPASDMWFVGTGQSGGATEIWLYLMNTGSVAATANVTILTDTGQQNGLSSAITVQPNQSVSENVTPYVHGSQAVALHVQTASGQVAASAWEGGAGSGAWLPQANAPATSIVIPGLTVASSAARLFVTVPGSTDAHLKVVAYTPAGAVTQFPGTPVDASAGATTPLALNALGASAAGLKLTSDVPIVASVIVPGAGLGSFTTAAPPLTEQGVIAGNPAARGVTVGLLLTAPSAAAHVSISLVSSDGTVTTPAGGQGVTVAAGHSLAVTVPRPQASRQPFAIVVTPLAGSGPLYAARVVTTGSGGISAPVTSLLPVPSALTSISLPPAQDSYTAVIP